MVNAVQDIDDLFDLLSIDQVDDIKTVSVLHSGRLNLVHIERIPELKNINSWIVSDKDLKDAFGANCGHHLGAFLAGLIAAYESAEGAKLPILGINLREVKEWAESHRSFDALIAEILRLTTQKTIEE